MTKVTFTKKGDCVVEIEMDGHAGYAQSGQDIVCAAISSTTYMTVTAIYEILGFKLDMVSKQKEGYVKIDLHNVCNDKNVGILIRSLELFLIELSNQYPTNVHVSTRLT